MFERIFHLSEHKTTVGREIIGGAATFMALSYIVMVQPAVLSSEGMAEPMSHGGVFVATCVCSALACILAATGMQEMLIRGIPASLKYAVAVGIGLFIALVGLEWGGLVVDDPVVYVKLGRLGSPVALLTLFGLAVIGIMLVYNIRGALLYGVLLTAAAGLLASHYGAETWGYALVTWKGDIVSGLPDTEGTIGGVFAGFARLFADHPWTGWLTIIFIFLILDIFEKPFGQIINRSNHRLTRPRLRVGPGYIPDGDVITVVELDTFS